LYRKHELVKLYEFAQVQELDLEKITSTNDYELSQVNRRTITENGVTQVVCVWVATPDVNVNTTSFTVKMERPIKLYKDWCCVPQCKSDGRKRGK
jgi:hypothetical protein